LFTESHQLFTESRQLFTESRQLFTESVVNTAPSITLRCEALIQLDYGQVVFPECSLNVP
jgi:hypothetical protein